MKKNCICVKLSVLLVSVFLVYQSSISQPSSVIAPVPLSYSEHWMFVEASDTINGSWNRIQQLQTKLFGISSYYLQNINKVFICGGIDSTDNPKTECYMYNPVTNAYESRDTLPSGRAYGKLVKVKDSLYLVGSVHNFNIPDGALFKYYPGTNQWQIKAPVPAPVVHEMAVCVWNDSLIYAIGGSTGGFGAAVNTVRIYNPSLNTWKVLAGLTSSFPVNICAAQAECIGNRVIVVGGFNGYPLNKVYKGYVVSPDRPDSIGWLEDSIAAPFGTGIYRLGGGKFGSFMVFGPALSAAACINQVWGFNLYDSSWTQFLPNTLDPASRTSIAVKHTADSLHFYIFGGITRDTGGVHFINTSEKYSTGNPVIGIAGNNNRIPQEFVLHQNYPNPFNPSTRIKFDIPAPLSPPKGGKQVVKLVIFDILGREVGNLFPPLWGGQEGLQPGNYEVVWDGTNYPSGIYFYRLESGNYTETKKMVLLK